MLTLNPRMPTDQDSSQGYAPTPAPIPRPSTVLMPSLPSQGTPTGPVPSPTPLVPSLRPASPSPSMRPGSNPAFENAKFNQWYGSLPSENLSQFDPKSDTFTFNGADAHARGGVSGRTDDELAAARRQNARAHFVANILPSDPDYQNMQMGGARGSTPLAPSGPTAGPGQVGSTRYGPDGKPLSTTIRDLPPTKPVVTKPGKPLGDQIAGVVNAVGKAGSNILGKISTGLSTAARNSETTRHNQATEALGNQRVGQGQRNIDNRAATAATAQDDKATNARLKIIHQRQGVLNYKIEDKSITPEELSEMKTLYTEAQGLIDGMKRKPTTQPAPGSGGGVIQGPPATSTQPFQPAPSATPAAAPTTPTLAGGRGPAIPPGYVPHNPQQQYPVGTEGVDAQQRPIVFDGKEWKLK